MNLPPKEKDIKELLGLQGYGVEELVREREGDVPRESGLPEEGACPRCGVLSHRGHQWARDPSRILWAFLALRPLWIEVRRRRLWCGACQRAFTQHLPGVAPRQRMSGVAQEGVLGVLREQSFAGLQRTLGVSYGRARRVLLRLPLPWYPWEELVGREGPIYLGIDEHSFRGRDLVITITCLNTHRPLAILPDDRQQTLRRFLESLPPGVCQRVSGVCTDIKESFRRVVLEVLPRATRVVDHFHLIQDANRRLDETRRLEQAEAKKTLPRWPLLKGQERLTPKQRTLLGEMTTRFPTLAEGHWLKEGLRALYRCPSLEEAKSLWQRLLLNAFAADDAEVVRWGRTLKRWQQEILNYFTIPITNAYTEGIHTKPVLSLPKGSSSSNASATASATCGCISTKCCSDSCRALFSRTPHLLT